MYGGKKEEQRDEREREMRVNWGSIAKKSALAVHDTQSSLLSSHNSPLLLQATAQVTLAAPAWLTSVTIETPRPAAALPAELPTLPSRLPPPPPSITDKQLLPNQKGPLHPLQQPSCPTDPPGRYRHTWAAHCPGCVPLCLKAGMVWEEFQHVTLM